MAHKLNLICKHCGDHFEPTKEEIQLHEDGETGALPNVCDECFGMLEENAQGDYYEHSDADSGL